MQSLILMLQFMTRYPIPMEIEFSPPSLRKLPSRGAEHVPNKVIPAIG